MVSVTLALLTGSPYWSVTVTVTELLAPRAEAAKKSAADFTVTVPVMSLVLASVLNVRPSA